MLSRVAHDLTAALDPGEQLFRIARSARLTGRADSAYVERADFERDEVEVVAGVGIGYPPLGTRVPYPGSLAEEAIERGEPEVIPRLTEDPRPSRAILAEACGVCDGMVAPLISEGEALGALVLLRTRGSPPFTGEDLELIRALSDLGALSLRRVLVLDESERRRRRAETMERRLRSLFVHNPSAVVALDVEGRLERLNPAAERLVDYRVQELRGSTLDRLVHPADRSRAWQTFRRVLDGEAQFAAIRILRRGGRIRNIEATGIPIVVDGRTTGVFAVISDVSERVATERALRQNEERLRTTLEALPIGVWFTDDTGRVIYGNPAGRHIWGGSHHVGPGCSEEHRGWWPDTGKRIDADQWALVRALSRREASMNEAIEIEALDGTRKTIRNWAVPLVGSDDELYGAVVVNEDITERVRAERERERALESRTRLVRGLSHDLKNPLGAADGQLAMLEEGVVDGLTDGQRKAVLQARSSLRAALGLIDDLSDLARVEAGRLDIRRERVGVGALLREAADEHRAAAEAGDLALDVAAPEAPPSVETDPRRVRQILGNLLSNAIKYTPPGGRIRLGAELCTDGGAPRPGRWTALHVSDTGPGIPEDKQEDIFREFTRLTSNEGRGVGLGLAISRRLARLLEGEVTVESELGRGSTFTLWLPLRGGA